MLYFERKFERKGFKFIIGVDEAGRGPLAGPVVAGAVLLKNRRFKNRIIDSKKLSPLQRQKAFSEIIKKSIFNIGLINEKIIDRINIAQATRLAMESAIKGLIQKLKRINRGPGSFKESIYILVDGNVKLNIQYPYVNIIEGDNRSRSIAAASILSKFIRDHIMCSHASSYPQYGFRRHKGYPTRLHKMALKRYGPTDIHRLSFLKNYKRI